MSGLDGVSSSWDLDSFAYDSFLSTLFGDSSAQTHDAWSPYQYSHLFAEDAPCSSHGSAATASSNDANNSTLPGLARENDDSLPLDMVDERRDTDGLGVAFDANLEALHDHVLDLHTDSYRPPMPCSHCRMHRLQCLVIRTTSANPNPVTACSSCVALFRHCSLAEKPKRGPCEFETNYPVIANLHGIPEARATPSTSMQNPSDSSGDPQSLPFYRRPVEDYYPRPKRTSSRMRGRTRALRHWFFCHMDHPFPSEEEKVELTGRSGLTRTQVENWFINARRRQRTLDQNHKPQIYRLGSPIPQSTLADLTPFQRWRNSPPETDHVPLELVERAANLQPTFADPSSNDSSFDEGRIRNSYEGSVTVASAAYSDSSESFSSFGTLLSLGSHSSENSLIPTTRTEPPSFQESDVSVHSRYQCTFCPLSFKKKSDWCRHEASIHIQLEMWICQPQESIVWQIGSLQPQCNFCGAEPSSQEHLDSHDFQACAERPPGERTFARKDHLLQHLKKFHGCRKWAGQNLCVRPLRRTSLHSRCGFCNATFSTWSERENHLADHFRQGWNMIQWVGDWGFDPATTQSLKRTTLPSERFKSPTAASLPALNLSQWFPSN